MLKFTTINDIRTNKNWFLCHDIYVDGRELNKDLQINDVVIRYIVNHLNSEMIGTYIIISTKPETDSEIREFIINTLDKFVTEEIKYINERYYDIIVDDFTSRIKLLLEKAFRELSMNYVITLITNPIVLKKSLNLAIMSFYFGVKLGVKFKELDDLIYSSILVNLNMCDKGSLKNIHNDNFLIEYKESIVKSSYDLIKDDNKITNNVKRIVRYANISHQNPSDIYYKTDEKTGHTEAFLKDVTLEVLQMSNDILTYDFNEDDIRHFYSLNKYTSVVQPAINMIISDIDRKKNDINNTKKSLFEKFKEFFFGLSKSTI